MNDTQRKLLAAIAAEPNNDAQRLVYADWLIEHDKTAQGELKAHGELIHLQCRRPVGDPMPREELALAQKTLQWFMAEAALPPPEMRPQDFERGFLKYRIAQTEKSFDPDLFRLSPEICRIERKLAHGSITSVWLARLVGPMTDKGTPVVAKQLDYESPETESRLLRDGLIASHIEHPHIAKGYGFALDGQRKLLALHELVDGRNLYGMARLEPMPVAVAIAFTYAIAQALEYVHQPRRYAASVRFSLIYRGLEHPTNVLLTGTGQVKILDFKESKVLGDSLPEELSDLSPPEHTYATTLRKLNGISPERCRGEPDTIASDIFNLGCLAYFAVCGRHAYSLETDFQTVRGILEGRFAHPELLTERCSDAFFRGLILRMLALEPMQRPSAAQIVTELKPSTNLAFLQQWIERRFRERGGSCINPAVALK